MRAMSRLSGSSWGGISNVEASMHMTVTFVQPKAVNLRYRKVCVCVRESKRQVG